MVIFMVFVIYEINGNAIFLQKTPEPPPPPYLGSLRAPLFQDLLIHHLRTL